MLPPLWLISMHRLMSIVAGQRGLMQAVHDATTHLPNVNVHFEAFGIDPVVDVGRGPCFVRVKF